MSVAYVADQVFQTDDCDCDGNQLDECGVCGGAQVFQTATVTATGTS